MAVAAVVLLAGAGGCARGAHPVPMSTSQRAAAPSPSQRAAPCPVTRPTGDAVPPRRAVMNLGTVSHRGWVHGGSLWAQIPAGSTLPAYDDPGTGLIMTKFGWFRASAGQVRVSGAPVGAGQAAFRSDVGTVLEYGPRGFTPSTLSFQGPGCWRLTGRLGGDSLVLVLRVTRQR